MQQIKKNFLHFHLSRLNYCHVGVNCQVFQESNFSQNVLDITRNVCGISTCNVNLEKIAKIVN